jgi:uncharacterized protein (TIGR03437 family)
MFLSQGDSVSGIQFDVQYDSSAMDLDAIVGDSARNSEKSFYYADLAPNVRRFLIVGLNQDLIPDGALITLFVNLNPNASNGVYSLAFSNVVGTDPYGNAAPVSGMDGTITVQGTGESVALQPSGVLSAGSLLAGPVAPGEIVTLIGSRIGPPSVATPVLSPVSAELAGTSVQFDGTPALVLYASSNRMNLVVPYEVSGKTTAQLQVINGGRVIASLPLSVVPTAPAIFTVDASGVGRGALLNEDSTLNSPSNPAARGSVAVLFATGVGQEAQVAGSVWPTPVLPVSVQIGGLNAEVLGADAGPEVIAGVVQVRFRIPANVTPGYSAPVVLTVGTVSSQPGVTLAIQ